MLEKAIEKLMIKSISISKSVFQILFIVSVLTFTAACSQPSKDKLPPEQRSDGGKIDSPLPELELSLLPSAGFVIRNGTKLLSATGGSAPYVFALVSGPGAVTPDANGIDLAYAPGDNVGAAVIEVMDSKGKTKQATIAVYDLLSVTPASTTLAVTNISQLVPAGGIPPYTFSVSIGTGTVNGTGLYTAPNVSGNESVRVTDSIGNTADATYTVNPALQLTETAVSLIANESHTFSAQDGVSPYTWSVTSGSGSVSSSGVFVAPAFGGTSVVRVTDSYGNTADATVTIANAMSISPTSVTLAVGNSTTFSTSGGSAPVTFSILSGDGSIDGSTGIYTAAATAGSAVVRATDSLGSTADATVTVNAALEISPSSLAMIVNTTQVFSAAGGVSPYTFSVESGSGFINASTGNYTAAATAGSSVVRVTDSLGNTADANISINNVLAISPTLKTLAVSNVTTFSASGGNSPYVFSILSGGGSINSSTGVYTAAATAGSAVIRVTDSASATADANVTINPALAISPLSVTLAVNNAETFSATGGVSPYTFSIQSGGGSINPSTGAYTAAATAGTAVVRVTDSLGNTSDSNITINPALAMTPALITLAVNNTQTFVGSGGVSPYVYSIQSGVGTISSMTGFYTAPASAGSAVILITDSRGNTSTASVTVTGALAISPTSTTLSINNSTTFSAAGGVAPYAYSVFSGSGSINSSTGVYTAGAISGSAVVRVTDGYGNTSDANVTINGALAISPSTANVVINGAFNFSASGGVSPYTFSIQSGGGSVNSSTGAFTAPATAGTVTVRVTDSLTNYSDATVTVVTALSISPATITLAVNNTTTFSASGGVSPYTFSIQSGGGSVNSTSGAFTAAATAGTVVVRVTDDLGTTADATVTVNAALSISPTTITLAVNNTTTFSATGGVAPYSYSVFSGIGTINSSTGVYVAAATSGSATIRVTDSLGNTSSATVTINPALSMSPSSVTLAVNNTQTFVASGGVSPYSFSIQSGTGSVGATTGVYTAPASPGSAVVLLTDSLGNTTTSSVTISGPLTISPASKTLAVNNSFTFSAGGGVSPYAFSIVSGGGSINATTGAFTAPATSGTVVIRVSDSLANTSDSTVTVNPALTISPTSVSVAVNGNTTLSGVNGVAPYTFSVLAGGGSINASTGVYVAPATSGSATVHVTDSVGNTANSAITIVPQLAISPTTKTLAVNNSHTFSASGGMAPYSFSIQSGGGSINATTGVYTAPATSGSAVVRVTDALSATASANVTINAALQYNAAYTTIAAGNSLTTTASGGVGPYSYSVVSGGGSINGSGLYVSSGAGAVLLRVTDSLSNVADLNVTVNDALTLSPGDQVLLADAELVFTATNGVPPYTYSIIGNGTIDADTGAFIAQSDAGTDTVRVTDSIGNIASSQVTTYTTLAISPATALLILGNNQIFTTSGGFGSMTFSMQSGTGSVDSVTGEYNADGSAGTDVVRVTDSLGNVADATITVVNVLALNPAGGYVGVNRKVNFSAIGGTAPYVYSIVSGPGTIDSGTGVYSAPSSPGTVTVRVSDNMGGTSEATYTIIEPTAVFAGGAHHCVIFNTGAVKCWGKNTNGQLGIASTTSKGDNANEMSDALPFVDLGVGRTATSMALGDSHSCALLDDSTVKCWGYNITGQLGYGDVTQRTSPPLTTVSLGENATAIYAGGSNTCALLASGALKCWGNNTRGQLGQGNTTYSSTPVTVTITTGTPSISSITIGSDVSSTSTITGGNHICALMSDGTVKCWGYNNKGQLARGNTSTMGDGAGEVTSAYAIINLGTGLTATKIVANNTSTCALLNNSSIKCWGNATSGQLGNGSTTNSIGDIAGELGDSMPVLNTGLSPAPNNIFAAGNSYCATNSSGQIKCWGKNSSGHLGIGSTSTIGDAVGEVASSALTSLSSTITPSQITSSPGASTGFCALLTNKEVKCWGPATNGRLGNASTTSHKGDAGSEMGDTLGVMVFAGSL